MSAASQVTDLPRTSESVEWYLGARNLLVHMGYDLFMALTMADPGPRRRIADSYNAERRSLLTDAVRYCEDFPAGYEIIMSVPPAERFLTDRSEIDYLISELKMRVWRIDQLFEGVLANYRAGQTADLPAKG